jgi:hypothetical protein
MKVWVTGNKIMAMKTTNWHFRVWVIITEVDKELIWQLQRREGRICHSLNLYSKLFDYSPGGYYHQERWVRTRRYYHIKRGCNDYKLVQHIWAYTRNFLTIASGATPIGSAGHAPDDIYSWILEQGRRKKIQEASLLPSGGSFLSIKVGKPEYFVHWNSQTRLRHMILELRYRDKTRMPWLKYITKVRPQDPSCVAWYTHMGALYWYVSVSTTQRKILVDALGTLRTTGIHSL